MLISLKCKNLYYLQTVCVHQHWCMVIRRIFTYIHTDSDLLRFSLPICLCPLPFAYGVNRMTKKTTSTGYIYGKAYTCIHISMQRRWSVWLRSVDRNSSNSSNGLSRLLYGATSLMGDVVVASVLLSLFLTYSLYKHWLRAICVSLYYFCERLEMVCAGGSIDWFWNVIPLRGFFFSYLLV